MLAGRVEFYFGRQTKFSLGDFDGKSKSSIGLAAFIWGNDDNNVINAGKYPVDTVDGIELPAAYRGHGVSIDANIMLLM